MVCRLVVKPVESKKFTGKVISSIKGLIGCGAYNEDFEILCSEPIEFMREWRCFVYYDQIIDVRPYKGDWHYNYDAEVLDEIMDQFIEWDKDQWHVLLILVLPKMVEHY